jgi:hypothetical protein
VCEVARKRKKKKRGGYSQQILLLLSGSLLTLCVLSIAYGVLIRKSIAEDTVRQFRIEILNGTGKKGLASSAAMGLREKGIDVFRVENAPHYDYEESILIARREVKGLGKLAKRLGCRNVIEQLKADSMVDATLIIGADYGKLDLGIDADSGLLD